jgi:acyl carrier protein
MTFGMSRNWPEQLAPLRPKLNMAEKAQSVMQASSWKEIEKVRAELAVLIVNALGLEVSPHDINADAPLYGEGLGLDSIDILEIALVVSKEYGIQLKADSQENHAIFASLSTLSEFVVNQRTK